MQRFEIRTGEIARHLGVSTRAHFALLHSQVIGDGGLERMSVLAAAVQPAGLRVLADGGLRQQLLPPGARLLRAEYLGRLAHATAGTAMPVLHGPCAVDLAASGETQPETETGKGVVPFEMIVLACRQGERGHGLLGELHRPSGEATGKQPKGY